MPIYSYRCSKCGEEFDLVISYEDYANKNNRRCPECHSTKLRRKIDHAPSIRFKGNGFYTTDSEKNK